MFKCPHTMLLLPLDVATAVADRGLSLNTLAAFGVFAVRTEPGQMSTACTHTNGACATATMATAGRTIMQTGNYI